MARPAFYLNGIAPPHVRLTQIFAGALPYVAIVIFCMAVIYVVPATVTWLPNLMYNR